MSEYQEIRTPRLRLRSLEAVKARLNIKELRCAGGFECLTSGERLNAFGESISTHLSSLNESARALTISDQKGIEAISKVLSLDEALSEEKHALLMSLVNSTLSAQDIQILTAAREIIRTGDVKRLSALQEDASCLLQKMTKRVKEAHLELAAVEREVLAEKTVESLRATGYQVRTKSVGPDLLVRGKKQDLSIAARITVSGEVHVDMAGFENGACTKELDRLNVELSKRGIGLETAKREHHGRKEGGVLAQKAVECLPISFNPLEDINKGSGNQKRFIHLKNAMRKVFRR